jgi:DNA-binding NarL/FixJ family response regulator
MVKIRVLVAEDHAVVRQGLRLLINEAPDIEVIAEAENGRQAVVLARTLQPAVILMDVAMPLLNGVEATRQILAGSRTAKVLILTSYSDDNCIKQAMAAGAAGFLLKQSAASELLAAIREVSLGNAFFSPAIAKRLQEQCVNGSLKHFAESSSAEAHLTNREAEVLQLIAEGFANKQIAVELGISIKTVEKHRQQVLNKLNIHDVARLTRHAVATGMVGRDMRLGC